MRIGLVTDSLADMPLDRLLPTAAELGIQALEFGCGNWSSAPHLNLAAMLDSAASRQAFAARLRDHGLAISALNCSGNPLHPGESGQRHREVTSQTIRLAGLLGVSRVVLMSGCPGGPGDANANWITTAWPPESARVLQWQWDEAVIPYWRNVVTEAQAAGVTKLCLELHGQQNVYNVETLFRLRDAVGPTVGANYDPSHLFWMGADPLAATRALVEAIYHVHAKDTRIDPVMSGVNGLLDTKPVDRLRERSWSYVTLGYGHGVHWWKEFCGLLRLAGYDDVLSIEHEDLSLPPLDGVRKSVALLREAI
ncbi:MAG TPA: sugar phosphate isomerase/epimerase [Acetobacteraceae bacterium]|nr:sugar phosphate isomerase/epimerase [Acetobacteraceae bacterium]